MSVCALISVYRQPQNIAEILEQVLASSKIDHVVIVNCNPELDIHEWLDLDGLSVDVFSKVAIKGTTARWKLALNLPFDYFYCVDDDVCLNANQITEFITKSLVNPKVSHGLWGQLKRFHSNQAYLSASFCGYDCEVDVVNRCCFYSKENISKSQELAISLGFKNIDSCPYVEDVIISLAGEGRSRLHSMDMRHEQVLLKESLTPSSLSKEVLANRNDTFLKLS